MKLRYQMRGLGVGIIVTALLMGVALDERMPLSDAEIKLLASELGMVEEDSLKLSDVQQSSGEPTEAPSLEPTAEPTEQPTPEPTAEPTIEPTSEPTAEPTTEPTPEPTAKPTIEPTPEPTAEPTIEPTPEPTAEPTTEPTPDVESEGTIVTIVVKPGASSYSVSKQLAEAGLVESTKNYDKYLCDNGYADRIQVGTFEIPVGSSEQEIAKIITKSK